MEEQKKSRLGLVGGQAVLEGVMMKSGNDVNLAVRGEDGKKVSSQTDAGTKKTVFAPIYRLCRTAEADSCISGGAGYPGGYRSGDL